MAMTGKSDVMGPAVTLEISKRTNLSLLSASVGNNPKPVWLLNTTSKDVVKKQQFFSDDESSAFYESDDIWRGRLGIHERLQDRLQQRNKSSGYIGISESEGETTDYFAEEDMLKHNIRAAINNFNVDVTAAHRLKSQKVSYSQPNLGLIQTPEKKVEKKVEQKVEKIQKPVPAPEKQKPIQKPVRSPPPSQSPSHPPTAHKLKPKESQTHKERDSSTPSKTQKSLPALPTEDPITANKSLDTVDPHKTQQVKQAKKAQAKSMDAVQHHQNQHQNGPVTPDLRVSNNPFVSAASSPSFGGTISGFGGSGEVAQTQLKTPDSKTAHDSPDMKNSPTGQDSKANVDAKANAALTATPETAKSRDDSNSNPQTSPGSAKTGPVLKPVKPLSEIVAESRKAEKHEQEQREQREREKREKREREHREQRERLLREKEQRERLLREKEQRLKAQKERAQKERDLQVLPKVPPKLAIPTRVNTNSSSYSTNSSTYSGSTSSTVMITSPKPISNPYNLIEDAQDDQANTNTNANSKMASLKKFMRNTSGSRAKHGVAMVTNSTVSPSSKALKASSNVGSATDSTNTTTANATNDSLETAVSNSNGIKASALKTFSKNLVSRKISGDRSKNGGYVISAPTLISDTRGVSKESTKDQYIKAGPRESPVQVQESGSVSAAGSAANKHSPVTLPPLPISKSKVTPLSKLDLEFSDFERTDPGSSLSPGSQTSTFNDILDTYLKEQDQLGVKPKVTAKPQPKTKPSLPAKTSVENLSASSRTYSEVFNDTPTKPPGPVPAKSPARKSYDSLKAAVNRANAASGTLLTPSKTPTKVLTPSSSYTSSTPQSTHNGSPHNGTMNNVTTSSPTLSAGQSTPNTSTNEPLIMPKTRSDAQTPKPKVAVKMRQASASPTEEDAKLQAKLDRLNNEMSECDRGIDKCKLCIAKLKPRLEPEEFYKYTKTERDNMTRLMEQQQQKLAGFEKRKYEAGILYSKALVQRRESGGNSDFWVRSH